DHNVNAIVSKNNVLYVGTASTISGVYYTTDLISWTDISTGLESYDRSVSQLAATDEYLYKTGSTINSHQIPLPELNTTWDSLLPLEFSLYQNYPNPFNPATIFRYDLPKNTNVKLTIYDLMGKIVKNLVSDQQNSGYKLIQWNSTNNKDQPVSAGMYFYTIQAGEFRETRKMILLK
ncbi:MAG: T9SS type A sorting domain-containing protein, partial [Candidatus Marinimicrobia bacterium]|nr:T9SS type A sorting domain-containing protein [Candidatus Neomarinimicrobiota bacterium]